MSVTLNEIHLGDCVNLLDKIEAGSVDLVFADPPFNIGYEYDVYDDAKGYGEYLSWCAKWIGGVRRCLKPNGTFWLAIGDEYAAELKIEAQKAGFKCRSWVIWYYTFGVNCAKGFSRSHTHLFHFVVDPKDFTFNGVNPQVRVPSARQLVYGDTRANPQGRLPDNTWIMRPQDVPESFRPDHDTWYFARVAGTFKEREGFHGCQMPEQLLGRIIRTSSNPGDVVLDPFSGSGTTLRVAKKLGRRWMGIELSKDYVGHIKKKMAATNIDDPLTGPEDPLKSAPSTAKGKRRKNKSSSKEIEAAVLSAFKTIAAGHSVDHLLCDPGMSESFVKAVRRTGTDGNEVLWKSTLLKMRKSKKLPGASVHRKRVSFKDMDGYSFASEIAMRLLSIDFGMTIENILCCSDYAQEFDRIASEFAPGFESFDYRWAALAIRKRSRSARRKGCEKFADWFREKLPRAKKLDRFISSEFERPGVYLLSANREKLYVGECENIADRIKSVLDNENWLELSPASAVVIPTDSAEKYALQSVLIGRLDPWLNSQLLHPGKMDTAV